MSTKPTPRVRVPAQVKPGEVFEIKTLISHEMESGQRKDSAGKIIPRKIINKFIAQFNGKTVFEAETTQAVSQNPLMAFPVKVTEPGTVKVTFQDTLGKTYTSQAEIKF